MDKSAENLKNDINPVTFEVGLEAFAAENETTADEYNLDITDNIKILPPLDPNFSRIERGANNIRTNKGDGIILYAVNGSGSEKYKLAKIKRRTDDPTYEAYTETSYYTVEYNNQYFDSNGTGKDNCRLTVLNGKLCFIDNNNGVELQSFTVETFGKARPGDDFQLRFGLNENTAVAARAGRGDFMAVYDKKLLWRANLYIDEGVGDWNNKHPWIAGNEWYVSQADGADVDGGQIDIKSVTRFDINETLNNTVIYSWGDNDSLTQYNSDVAAQAAALGQSATTAPGNNWTNYKGIAGSIYREKVWVNQGVDNAYRYWKYKSIAPSIPGLTSFLAFQPYDSVYNIELEGSEYLKDTVFNNNKGNYHPSQTKFSSGVDCSGFVQSAASYQNRIYSLVAASSSKAGTTTIDNASTSITNENLVIPGDILMNRGNHVVIVLKVEFFSGTRSIDTQNSYVIEAWAGDEVYEKWRVWNQSKWGEQYEDYTTKRLRVVR